MTTITDLSPVVNTRWAGRLMAASSIHQGGDKAGTVSLLRRERIILPDMTVHQVPVISGNGVRGVIRRFAAKQLWAHLGKPKLAWETIRLIATGGALTKSTNKLNNQELRYVREAIPHLSVMGWSGAGAINDGRLIVGKMVPVTQQTRHIVKAMLPDLDGDLLDMWGLINIEEFSRNDGLRRGAFDFAHGTDTPDPGQLIATQDDDPGDAGDTNQMRYGIETLAAGTPLVWHWQLTNATPQEEAVFLDAVHAWQAAGMIIGGRGSSGHGRLDPIDPIPAPDAGVLGSVAEQTRERAAEIVDLLAGCV